MIFIREASRVGASEHTCMYAVLAFYGEVPSQQDVPMTLCKSFNNLYKTREPRREPRRERERGKESERAQVPFEYFEMYLSLIYLKKSLIYLLKKKKKKKKKKRTF